MAAQLPTKPLKREGALMVISEDRWETADPELRKILALAVAQGRYDPEPACARGLITEKSECTDTSTAGESRYALGSQDLPKAAALNMGLAMLDDPERFP